MTERTIILPPGPQGNGENGNYRLTVMTPKRRYLSYLRERWWVVVVCVALAVSGIVTHETLRPSAYTSFAQLYTSGEIQVNGASLFNEEAQTYFGTQIELLRSARLQNAALEKIGYAPKPDEKAPVKVEIVQPMKTSIFVLQATGADPALTQGFLKALIDVYLAYKKETRISSSEDVLLSMTEQLSKRERELKAQQDEWADFQRTNNVAVLEEEAKSAGLYLADLNLELAKMRLERQLLVEGLNPDTNLLATVQAGSAPTRTNSSSEVGTNSQAASVQTSPTLWARTGSDNGLKTARVELAVRRAEKEQLQAERGELAARRVSEDVVRLERTVGILEEQNRIERKITLDELDKRIAAIGASVPAWEAKVLSINDRLSQGQRLKSNIQRVQGYYDHLLGTLQNVDLSKSVQQERLAVLQPPTAAQPEKRFLALRILLAGLGGLALSLGIVFCWYLLDDRFVSVRDIKDQFGEMILGLVPEIKVPRSKPEEALLKINDDRQAYAESYRHLRSALLLSPLNEAGAQTLLFTGAVPSEGKTTIAANLARVLAGSGLRVILVNADSHGGGMEQLMRTPEAAGVSDYLRGDAEMRDILNETGLPGLKYVPAGLGTEHAEGLYLKPRLIELVRELRGACEFVILDSPPILAADDAALLVPHADVVILVVRPFFSRSRLVRQALDMLYQRQAKQVTIVLNRARKDDLAGHYYKNGRSRTSRNGAAFTA